MYDRRCVLLLVAFAAWAGTLVAAEKKVVIPFDFVSKFDHGRYGRTVGEMIFKKLDRQRGFIIPESMLDTRDFCKANNLYPTPETSLAKMARIVRGDFAAHVGIWGSVERVAGHDWDVYDLVVKCVDFSGETPRMIYECNVRTKTVSEIPHLYVKAMLEALYDRPTTQPPPVSRWVENNWRQNPNLVAGDFQRGAGGVPSGWDSHWQAGAPNQREPLGRTVRWQAESGDPENRLIRFTMSKALGDNSGVAYYSKRFPVEHNARYRFQCRWKTDGPSVKVFVKCYAPLSSESQLREVYRSQQNVDGARNTWNVHTQDFTPRHAKYAPRFGRVMLYAFVGAGVVEFDDVIVKQIESASPGDSR